MRSLVMATFVALSVSHPAASSPALSGGDLGPKAQECLSRMIYHEARGESLAGQKAVAEVIVNRARSGGFPGTVCGVVRQPGQFTRMDKAIREPAAYKRASDVARMALAGRTGDVAKGATYFHTHAVRPSWSSRFDRVAVIGAHAFYKP